MTDDTQPERPLGSGDYSTEPPNPTELDPLDEAMANLLADGQTHAAVANALQVSPKTVQRRMKIDSFRSRVMELRRERLEATTAKLIGLSDYAIEVIQQSMGAENDLLRFRAAEAVLRLGRRHHKEEAIEVDFGSRMVAVERFIQEKESEEQ